VVPGRKKATASLSHKIRRKGGVKVKVGEGGTHKKDLERDRQYISGESLQGEENSPRCAQKKRKEKSTSSLTVQQEGGGSYL